MPVFNHHLGYQIDTNPERFDIDAIKDFLNNHSYWAQNRTRDQIVNSILHSAGFGLFNSNGIQIGFARVVTDWTTFAWLCDVYVVESERGLGLGKWLLDTVMNFRELKTLRRFMLVTRDAQELYRHYGGFSELENPDMCMERVIKNL
jgi:GNAT superfamily N-acetyltransferase